MFKNLEMSLSCMIPINRYVLYNVYMFNAFHSGGQWERANVANRGEKDKGKEGKVIFLDFFANN